MMREQSIGRGRFEVRATLGTGAFGTVLAALDRERGHLVAIKRPHLHAAESLYRFKQEFRALADLSHPNLVGLHELFEDAGHWFFTMELVDGVPLTTYLRGELGDAAEDDETLGGASFDALGRTLDGPSSAGGASWPSTAPVASRSAANPLASPPPLPDLERLRSCFAQVGRALLTLHAAHMLHRDIKPSNILVTATGRVVVLDFGLVRREQRAHHSDDDSVVGTPLYMAPEQWLGESVSEAADWYSVGVMLYEALLGEPPFRGSLLTIMQAKAQDEFIWPCVRSSEVPPDLDALCRELLRADPEARPRGPAVLRRLEGEPDTSHISGVLPLGPRERVFVGRGPELAALQAAQGGPLPAVLHVRGEAGIGKTALCETFLERVEERGGCVLRGRCFEQESVPYKALDAVIDELGQSLRRRSALELARLLPREAGLLARTFPVLEKIVGARDGSYNLAGADFNPLALRRRTFAVLRELLRRLAAAGPLVICIDDLQWGDAESAAIVHGLLRPPDPPQLLLLLSHRSDDDGPGPFLRELRALEAQAGALPGGQIVGLQRLSEDEGRALVTALSPAGAAPRRRERVVRESAGIPLLLDQLARAVPEGSEPSVDLGDEGPDLLAHLLARQLAELPAPARRVLELVAVAGVPLRLELLAAAAGVPVIDRAILQPLRVRHLVRVRETAGERRLAPSYGQIAATVVAGLELAERRACHLALAGALAAGDAAPRLIATHYHAAGALVPAGEHIRRAAEQAAAALAFAEAAACYGLALAWHTGDEATRRQLQRGHADALVNAGRGREAAPIYLGLVEGAAPLAAIELRRLAAEQLLSCGDLDAGESQLQSLIDEQDLGYPRSPGRAMLAIGYGLVRLKMRGTGFVPREPAAIDPAALSAVDTCLSASRNLALVRTLYSMGFGVKGLRLALEAGERERIVEALAAVGGALSLTGDAHGRRLFEQAESLAELLATPRARGLVALWKGFQQYSEGHWAASRTLWDSASGLLGECPGLVTEQLRANAYVLLALMHLGEYRELALRTEASMAVARATGNLYTEVTALMYSALPRLAAGDLGGAKARIRAAEDRSPRDGWNSLSRMKLHVQCALYGGEASGALARLEAAQPEIEASRMRSFGIFRVVVGGMHAGTALQVLADGGGDRRTLLKIARRELARFVDTPMPFAQGIANLVRAGLAGAEGDAKAAVRHTEAAVHCFEDGACWTEAACATRRLGQQIGGAAGREKMALADEALRSRGVADPARWTACFAPGFINAG